MARKFLAITGTVALWLALASTVIAQVTAPGVRFDIQGYAVEGVPLLSSEDFSRIVSPFIGKQKSAADIQKAQQALQQTYLDLGHCSVQVTVPNMQPEGGTVTLKLVQSQTPVSKNCLPMVALGDKKPGPNAPGVASVPQPAPAASVVPATGLKPVAKPPAVIVQAPAVAPSAESTTPGEPAPAGGALKFDIERYVVEGNTLLKPNAIRDVLRRYTGKQKDFADVQRALEALQAAYQTAGWGVVQVTLPEQELERGEVRFDVIEIRLAKVEVQGNEYFSTANVRRSVPSLSPGATPNSIDIARSLKVANENPSKQSQVSLKSGAQDGEVDAVVKVVDENPRKYSIGLDNTGTSSTGVYRLGFGFLHSNLWGRDHQLSLQYITDPEHPSKVTVLGLGYHIPLYARGDSIDVILGYSDVDSGTLNQLYLVSGAGTVVLGRYNQNLNRIGDYEHKITYGIDYKAYQNKVTTLTGAPLVPDITVHPVSATYAGLWRSDVTDVSFYGGISYHPFPGGNDDAPSNFKASRGCSNGTDTPAPNCTTGATAEYTIWRFGGNYTRLLPKDWSVRVALNGQLTRNALVAGEQFGIGGANSVRGFNERTYTNDKGYQTTFELYTPDLAPKLGLSGTRLRLLAFYDTGTLGRNFIQPGEQTGLSIDSIGMGLRLVAREKLTVRVDYAQVKHDGGQDPNQTIRDGRRNSNTLHAAAVLVF